MRGSTKPFQLGYLPDRIAARVVVASDCWVWTGCISPDGYGRFFGFREYGTTLPHRAVWQVANGPVVPGLELDHLCNNRACVRPDHLEPVSHQENVRRAWARRGTCRNGHPIDQQVSDYAGGHRCLICRRAANAASARRRRSRSAAA